MNRDDDSLVLEQNLELWFGESTDTQARVYARLDAPLPSDGWSLSGTAVGPHSRYAQTLTSTSRFTARPVSGSLLAEAIVLDPCFWTPTGPYLYRVGIELLHDGRVEQRVERIFGIRPLGPAGQNLMLDNRRWVLRGVEPSCVQGPLDLPAYREATAALVVDVPSDGLCREASETGVLIAASISPQADVPSELRRLARWPAVGLAILPTGGEVRPETRRLAGNLILVQTLRPGQPAADWAHAVTISAEDCRNAAGKIDSNVARPVLVHRRIAPAASIEQARAECDRLQSDLAPLGDFAGYIVGSHD